MGFTFRELQPNEFAQAMEIRIKVFVEEQKVPYEEELDSYDHVAQHFGVFLDQRLVGTGRLVSESNVGKVGRVAILAEFRKLGLGSKLMQYIIETGQDQGLEDFSLAAQLQAMDFYHKLGFFAEGDVFQDGGIDHRTMRYRVNRTKEDEK